MGCRIAGVENSYKIMASEMDGATLKLYTLAEVAGRLMKKNPPPYLWSAEVENLPGYLRGLMTYIHHGGRQVTMFPIVYYSFDVRD